jgi:hypothetical protein
MALSDSIMEQIRIKILDEVRDSQVIKPILNAIVQKGTIKEGEANAFNYAYTVGQMVTIAYTKAGMIMKKPLNQEEKDQIFSLVDEIRSEIKEL